MNCRFIAPLVCLLGCDQCPSDPSEFHGLRVLGVTVDPPVGTPGGRGTLTLVSVDVEDRAPTVTWYRCPLAGGDLGGARGSPSVDEPGVTFARACLTAGEVARGRSVTVDLGPPIPAAPLGGLVGRRRWDFLGFACPAGRVDPPPPGGVWPRCTGATGVLFRASVPGPLPDGSNPTPAPVAITAVRFGPEGAEVPITETDRPEVPRCEAPRSRCPTFVFRLATDPPGVLEREGMDFARAAVELRPGAWHASALYEAIAPAESPRCNNDDLGAGGVLRWSAPAAARDVRVLFVLRASDGGFAWARRTVRVR